MNSRPMNVAAVQRQLRQIALPEIGPTGQERLAAARVAIAGDDLLGEVAARYLAAAGVGTLRLIGGADGASRDSSGDGLLAGAEPSLRQSNPDLAVERCAWPEDAAAWLGALDGADLVLRSGFDDDAMGRAAVRLGIPAVVARATADRAELISFRRQGPCPHAPLDVAPRAAATATAGPASTVAATLAAAEAILILAGARATTAGERRAHHLSVALDGGDMRAQEIPWAPECFACGGNGMEMAFS